MIVIRSRVVCQTTRRPLCNFFWFRLISDYMIFLFYFQSNVTMTQPGSSGMKRAIANDNTSVAIRRKRYETRPQNREHEEMRRKEKWCKGRKWTGGRSTQKTMSYLSLKAEAQDCLQMRQLHETCVPSMQPACMQRLFVDFDSSYNLMPCGFWENGWLFMFSLLS